LSYFTEFIEGALNNAVEGNHSFDRLPGYHASSAGSCPKKVMVLAKNPKALEKTSRSTQGVFNMGHIIDEWFKTAIDKESIRSSRFFTVHPFACRYVPRYMPDGDFEVIGELDACILEPAKKTIHIVDCKSAGHDQFFMKKKEISSMNALQVATYAMSEEVADLAKSMGDWQVLMWLVYVDKENQEHVIKQVPKMFLEAADDYWTRIAFMDKAMTWFEVVPNSGGDAFDKAFDSVIGKLSEDDTDMDALRTPSEDWECGYCPLFPGLEDKSWSNKTEIKRARSVIKNTNMLVCPQLGYQHFMNKGVPDGQ